MTTTTIRVRNLTRRATEEIEDCFPDENHPSNLVIGVTYVEGDADDLLEAASRLREKEPWFDYQGEREDFYEANMKTAEAALVRWATKIEKTVERAGRGS